ncbi:uncharacterized protein [Spinacia oleracea]|uniref:Mechanosensitive ion channel protein n=1 Tax=Spinacia oleracea TaxID=3562 RepID=A0A9R0J7A9_SPIOL|nr:uncharacterized protein LOC110801664 [Spinacia oleracea]
MKNMRKSPSHLAVFSTLFHRIRYNSAVSDAFNLYYKSKSDEKGEKKRLGLALLLRLLSQQLLFKSIQNITPTPVKLMRLGARSKSKSDDVDEWAKQGIAELDDKDDGCENQEVEYSNVKKLSGKVKKRVKDDLLMQDGLALTIHSMQRVSQYLLTARKALSNDKYTSDILLNLERGSQDGRIIKKDLMKQFIEGGNNANEEAQQSPRASKKGRVKHEFDYFQDQLQDQSELIEEIPLKVIRAWMDRARTNCLLLANTLSSANEVVDCLNKIISTLLIAVIFIMWLLLTGFATIKLLVIIASPSLAATLIFGESCKTLFQGIIFTYVVHPFDVGDLCVIEEKMMEVRTIGVWKTTFTKVGTQEEVIFTNSQLTSKDIINHKTEFDWNDCVELDVASLNKKQIMRLKEKIEKHLEDNEEKKFATGYNCVTVLTTGDNNLKLAISFRHNEDR